MTDAAGLIDAHDVARVMLDLHSRCCFWPLRPLPSSDSVIAVEATWTAGGLSIPRDSMDYKVYLHDLLYVTFITLSCQGCALGVTAAARLRTCTQEQNQWFQMLCMRLHLLKEVRDACACPLYLPILCCPVIRIILSDLGASSADCPIALKLSTNM